MNNTEELQTTIQNRVDYLRLPQYLPWFKDCLNSVIQELGVSGLGVFSIKEDTNTTDKGHVIQHTRNPKILWTVSGEGNSIVEGVSDLMLQTISRSLDVSSIRVTNTFAKQKRDAELDAIYLEITSRSKAPVSPPPRIR